MNPEVSRAKSTSPQILRVLQSKDETRAFYNKIATVYDLLSERSEAPLRQAGLDKLVARSGEHLLEWVNYETPYTSKSVTGYKND